MATMAGDEFDSWLITKLQSLNTDENVFSSYIKGILEGDETEDEKNESLEGILSEITEADISKHCQEIFERWRSSSTKEQEAAAAAASVVKEDVDDRLVKLLENQAKPTIAARSYTDEEKKLREAILAQYSHMSDNEEEEEDGLTNGTACAGAAAACAGSGGKGVGATASGGASSTTTRGSGGGSGIIRNTNFEDVVKADKERREKAKQDAIRKKEKDKEDREKQKQAQQEKKEKRKTQKGERRR